MHATVKDDGTISASSPNFQTGTINASAEEKDLTVHIDAAPSPGLAGSVGYFFVWLEDESGDLYRKSGVTEVFLTSTEREVVSFEKGRPSSHGIITVSMIDGLYGGEVYLGREGNADIAASTSGYGTNTVRMNVGPERLNTECGVYLLDGVVTTVTLEMQGDVRDVLRDGLSSAKQALDSAGQGNAFSDIREARYELYRYDADSHDRLEDAVLELNESLGGNPAGTGATGIDVGSIPLTREGLRNAYLDLARLSSDIVPLDSRSIQSAIENVRIAIVYYEFDGNTERLNGEIDSLKAALKESGYGALARPIDAAAGRLSNPDTGIAQKAVLQNAKDTMMRIGTDESRSLLDALLVYAGEKTIERVYVERSRAAIDALKTYTLSDSETFTLPQGASELYGNGNITESLDRQNALDLSASIIIMQQGRRSA